MEEDDCLRVKGQNWEDEIQKKTVVTPDSSCVPPGTEDQSCWSPASYNDQMQHAA